MIIEKQKDKIIIKNPEDFDIIQTISCGQLFRYVIDGDTAQVFSKDKTAKIKFSKDLVQIETEDVDYFYNFFDLATDYAHIKNELRKDEFLVSAVDYGGGIRIINNDAYEMLISFMISANNNIGRIKKSINFLCERFGTNMGDYFAFPTLTQLKIATVQDFIDAGLGYRAEHMYFTVQQLKDEDIERLKTLSPSEKFNYLVSLKGVGEKVANCVLLFGLGVKNAFPVDTWINKVYNHLMNTNEKDRKKITRELTARYGELSGYAQQYFFYYYRDSKIK